MTLQELLVKIGVDVGEVERNLSFVEDRFQRASSKMLGAGMALTAGVTVPILAVGGASVKMAAEAIESENLVAESFKDMTGAAQDWSKHLSESLGLNAFDLRKNAGMLFTMTSSMGLSKQAAFDMSTGLTKLSADMSSFYNKRPAEIFEKLRSGIVGETEPLRALGILVDEHTVKHYAYASGIAKVGHELTEQQKVQARYVAILAQTQKAQGDLARTADSPVNQMRILGERVNQTSVEFGMALLPIVTQVIPILASAANMAKEGARWFAALPGPIKDAAVVTALLAAAAGPTLLLLGGLARAASSVAGVLTLVTSVSTTAAAGVGLLGGALSIAAQAAGVLAVAFAAWQVGKWIGNVSGLTDWIGKKLAGALYGVTPAQYGATRAAQEHSDAQAGQSKATADVDDKIKALNDRLKNYKEQSKEAIEAAKKLAEEQKKLSEAFAGKEVLKDATLMVNALKPIHGVIHLADDELKKVSDTLDQLIDKFTKLGKAVPSNLLKAAIDARATLDVRDLQKNGGQTALLKNLFGDVKTDLVKDLGPSPEDFADVTKGWQRLKNTFSQQMAGFFMVGKQAGQGVGFDPETFLPNHSGNIQRGQLFTAPTVDMGVFNDTGAKIGKTMVRSIGDSFKGEFGPTIMAALTGGGNILQSIGGLFGGNLTKSIFGSTHMQGLMTNTFGKTLGGMFNSLLPGIGALAGPLMAGIGKLFGKLFHIGGPSKEELAARDEYGKFLDSLVDRFNKTATAQEQVEAGGVRWKEVNIAVRDAYLAMGKSEQDAARDLEALNNASHHSAEEVRAAEARINEVLDAQKKKQDDRKKDLENFGATFKSVLDGVASGGQLASQELLGMVDQLKAAGQFTGEIKKFQQEAASGAASGFSGLATALTSKWTSAKTTLESSSKSIEDLSKRLAEARDKYAALAGSTVVSEAERGRLAEYNAQIAELTKQLDAAKATQATAMATLSGGQQQAQNEFGRLGRLAVATFLAGTGAGQSFATVLAQLQPGLAGMNSMMATFGFTADGTLKNLLDFNQIASVNQTLITGVDSLNKLMVGLNNTGAMNFQTFTDLTGTAHDLYLRLTEAGFGGERGLMVMQPSLQKIWELQQMYGFQVDASTAAMLTQAETAGLVGEKHKDAQAQIADGVNKLVELFGDFLKSIQALIPGAQTTASGIQGALDPLIPGTQTVADGIQGGMQGAFNALIPGAQSAASGIQGAFAGISVPTIHVPYEYDALNGLPEGASLPEMATGGIVTGPLHALIGEAGPEAVIPLAKLDALIGEQGDATSDELLDEMRGLRGDLRSLPFLLSRVTRDARMTRGM